MSWYLIHTKPKQEWIALQNLTQQGYECYLPQRPVEKIRRQKRLVVNEALFPRYLFVKKAEDPQTISYAAIRSTLGVIKMVSFGLEPVAVPDGLITAIQAQAQAYQQQPESLFKTGCQVMVNEGGFVDVSAIYQTQDGEQRAFVLIEMLGKIQRVSVATHNLRQAR